jgi:hypothetical protein
MTVLNPSTYALPFSKFSYDSGDCVFVAEASDLSFTASRGGGEAMLRRIYDDACDVGIAIRGNNDVVWFYLASEDRNRDGEIAGWRFKPVPEHVRRNPSIAVTSVLVIND